MLIALSAAHTSKAKIANNKGAPKSKIIDIDTGKSGTYISGKWKYVFTITNQGSKSQGCLGELYYNGKRVAPSRFLDLRKTPWGNIVWVGNPPLLWNPKGWMLRKKRHDKKLVPVRIDLTKSKHGKTASSNPYFSVLIPVEWKRKISKGSSGVFQLELQKRTGAKIPVSIYISFYPDNSEFSNYQDFIDSNSKNIFGETSTPREKYGPVKKITVNGMNAFHLSRDHKDYLHLNRNSNESVNIKDIYIVIPASKSFYILNYRAAKSDTDKYLSVFNKIVKSFKALRDSTKQ